jgi:hypothetical protein
MRLPNATFPMGRTVLTTMLLSAVVFTACNAAAASKSARASNPMRWEGHEAELNHGVAWQQMAGDGRWVTFVFLTDRPVPANLLANPNLLNPHESHGEDPMAKIGAQALQFQVTTGGIPGPGGLEQDVWYHEADTLRTSALSGAGGIDIDSLTSDRIKGRAVHGMPADKDMWSVSFDIPVIHGNAARMAAEGVALGKDGGQPGKDLIAALDAMRKQDLAVLRNHASPELAAILNDADKRESTLEFMQRLAGDSQQIVNGLQNGNKASVYWLKKWKDPKVRNGRCIDTMVLLDGKWRSSLSNCATE